MSIAIDQSFSVKNIGRILIKQHLLSRNQVQEILKKEKTVRTRLDNERRAKAAVLPGGGRVENPVTGTDIIGAFNLKRADQANRPLDEDTIFQAMAQEWSIPFRKIDPLKLDLNLVTATIPRMFALKHLVLPIDNVDGKLSVATPNPFNAEVMHDIARVTGLKVQAVISPKTDILRLIDEFFGFKRSIAMAEDLFASTGPDLGNLEQLVRLKDTDDLPSNDQHIVNAVNHLLIYAFDQRASDIHIEPKREITRVRMRIDGVLHTVYQLPRKVHNAIISRIKAMSRLDMSEKRRPQDGRIKTDKGGVEVEIRISTVPTAFGEKVVMWLTDPEVLFQDLETLGFTEVELERFNAFIQLPHGILLVTGPTGSGKTTTLYSALRRIASPEKNVITVEDPIEMVCEDFNQIGVQPAVGVDFGSILRTLLRQDPDIIMVGEIRDLETAQNAIQAALTGHLVLSTLHTNDAPTAITRMLDLGVQAFLIQATLIGVLAQRLLRKICPNCKEPVRMHASALADLGIQVGHQGEVDLHQGAGCTRCRNTGHRGRTGIYEVMPFSEKIREMTVSDADLDQIRKQAIAEGMTSLRESAIAKMLQGITTYQEVLRVTWELF